MVRCNGWRGKFQEKGQLTGEKKVERRVINNATFLRFSSCAYKRGEAPIEEVSNPGKEEGLRTILILRREEKKKGWGRLVDRCDKQKD